MKFFINLKRKLPKGKLIKTYSAFQNKIIYDNGTYKYDDLNSKKFKFDTSNPVDILIQKSYDDTVNLVLNDGKNKPRLINSRFSVTTEGYYEIIDRIGSCDTNIYNEEDLDPQTSLYKTYTGFPTIKLDEVQNTGNLKVGLYSIYIKYSDADFNETNIAAESGLIPCASGEGKFVDGHHSDYNSKKSIKITITDVDTSYDYITLYYSRYSSDQFQLTSTKVYKVLDLVPINGQNEISVIISGNENVEEITSTELNTDFDIINSAKTQSISNNMLFMGNIQKFSIDYENLADISLRVLPRIVLDTSAETTDYYDPKNVYYNVGYWNQEIYRFGIVYIFNNNTLSPVFNILGCDGLSSTDDYPEIKGPNIPENMSIYKNGRERFYLSYDQVTHILQDPGSKIYNNMGVIRIKLDSTDRNVPIKLGFSFTDFENIRQELLDMGIVGYFIVRQKRIPTILAQAMVLNLSENMRLPLVNKSICTVDRLKSNDDRCHELDHHQTTESHPDSNAYALICPEFTVRQPYYNQLFTGETFKLQKIGRSKLSEYNYSKTLDDVKLITVKDSAINVQIQNFKDKEVSFKAQAGIAEDAMNFAYDYSSRSQLYKHWKSSSTRIIRGQFSPYVGMISKQSGYYDYGDIVNIFISGYTKDKMDEYFKIRYSDNSPYYTISDKISIYKNRINELNSFSSNTNKSLGPEIICAKGDCYTSKYYQRIQRNFQDPTAPCNDILVSSDGYREVYVKDGDSYFSKIDTVNRGDVNAVKMNSYVDFIVQATSNLSIRSSDRSNPSEIALTSRYRSFRPLDCIDASGNNKIPESYYINEGFSQSLGQRYYFKLANIPYIRNNFTNQIMYSNISINDGYQNGLRIFKQDCNQNYNTQYGAITKILEYAGHLVVVFEHGIGLAQVNIESYSKNQDSEISINKAIPNTLVIISSVYGSKWKDSIIKTIGGIYGFDTDAKRIWRYTTNGLEVISDFKVNKFLNNNTNIGNYDKVLLGVTNVSTHYNAHKQDVMFTLYCDKTQWNLCFNEYTGLWSTFYSWIPLLSENINNVMFSFNKDEIKNTTPEFKLYKHNIGSKPTFWYDTQHPFEFEFIVAESPEVHKIFNNLEIIANKVEPESFHYQITSDTYDFSEQIEDVYYRQEINKKFCLDDCDEDFIQEYQGIKDDTIYIKNSTTKVYQKKTPIFPIQYYHDIINNDMYKTWVEMTSTCGKDYSNLAGSDLTYDDNEILINNHAPAKNINKFGRLRGNMQYKENRWFVQINPINIMFYNELVRQYVDNKPSLLMFNMKDKTVPEWTVKQIQDRLKETGLSDLGYSSSNISDRVTKSFYQIGDNNSQSTREEIKLKDKYIKIKVRYSGKYKASIYQILTYYTEVLR